MNQIPRREVEDFTDKDLQEIYAQVEDVDVVGIDAFKDEFLQSIEEAQEAHGIPLPFPNTEDLVRLRKSEVTVLAGINGHKKSTLLSQVLVHCAKEHKVGLASLSESLIRSWVTSVAMALPIVLASWPWMGRSRLIRSSEEGCR